MTTPFRTLVRERRSYRSFLPEPLDDVTLHETLADASWAPSNCNTQPWEVHIVSGAARDRLVAALLEAEETSPPNPDFSFDAAAYTGALGDRRHAQGAAYHEALGVERKDYKKRRSVSVQNLHFFGAPHAAFLFLPQVGDSVRVASDVGMFAQTFLLALAARGLAGVPQTTLGMFADTVRRELGISAESKLLFGISFGRPDTSAAAYRYRSTREPVETLVRMHTQ
ncbi:nitroreductase [Rhodococcus sp. DMU1]|uniref:nitroreductase n=1 Tax=Rhodococcus sp. DMU1 TaxID=2722825 RepID=UPI001FF0C77F|nr:nitroreductase [Rhodococcus sp. DMU1]